MRARHFLSITGFVRLLAMSGVVLAGTVAVSGSQASAAPPPISINGSEPGATFDGLGGMSVSGESRLLFDYPEKQQSQILDDLFCSPQVQAAPGYCTHGTDGAALQRLKVEIGSDTDSTVGSEPTVERQQGVVDCHVGYEFKLMAAARQRNPHIQIDALAWGFPGWIDPGGQSSSLGLPPDYGRVFSDDTISYLLNYLGCAKANHTPVDTLGIWNELPFLTQDRTQSEEWVASLRQALDSHGYSSVKIVADDGSGWAPLGICSNPQSSADTAFCKSVSVISNHYPNPASGIPAAWLHQNNIFSAGSFGKTWSLSNTSGASESLTFTGTSIQWIADTCYNAGMADVYLDGQLAAHDVDDYSSASAPGASLGCLYQQALFSRSGLSPGQHTIKIVVTGDHNPQSVGPYWIYTDAFAVDGTPNGTSGPCSVLQCVDDQSPQVQYAPVTTTAYPLWTTEDAPGLYDTTAGVDWYHNPLLRGDWAGARYLGQEINQNYVGLGITAEDVYGMLSSYYDQGQYAKDGLMTADTPWAAAGSGPSYDVQSRVWVMAHTTQFTQPGTWRYLGDPSSAGDTASCYLGTSSCTNSSGQTGSYVTLRDTNSGNYAIVAETKDATSAQPEQFCLSGGLSTGTVHVWETSASTAFANVANLSTSNGCFSYTLDPDAVYTFTSEDTGHAGADTQNYTEQGMTLPYSDNFQNYGSVRTQPRYFEDQQGAFETGHRCPPGGGQQWCLQQATTTLPIIWPNIFPKLAEPNTIVGNLAWTNYDVQARLTIPTVGQSASVSGRRQRSPSDTNLTALAQDARYQAEVTYQGNGQWSWTLYRIDIGPAYHVLASGNYSNGSAWITLTLSMDGSTLGVDLDGQRVGTATDTTYSAGMAGLATGHDGSTYDVADFANFCVHAPGGHC